MSQDPNKKKIQAFLNKYPRIKGLEAVLLSHDMKVAMLDGYELLYVVDSRPPMDAGLKGYKFFELNNGYGDIIWMRRDNKKQKQAAH